MDLYILTGSTLIGLGLFGVVMLFTLIGRWVAGDMRRTVKDFSAEKKPEDLEATYRRLTAAAEKRERALYLAVPSAFWLAPDGPLSVAAPAPKPAHPPCPNGCNAHILVMVEHRREATMWSCTLCGTDYTRHGKAGRINSKIARAGRMRELRHQIMMMERGLASPPAIYEPKQVFQSRMSDEDYDIDMPEPPGV